MTQCKIFTNCNAKELEAEINGFLCRSIRVKHSSHTCNIPADSECWYTVTIIYEEV